jgi:cyclase
MRLISRLDVKNGNLIKTINLEGLRPLGDCKKFAIKYMKENVDEIFLSDPVASLYMREPLFDLLDQITNEVFIPITISGGIRNLDDIKKLLLIGADKVSINTAAISNPSFINEAASVCGSQSIAISMQVKNINDKWYCYTNCGRDNSKILLVDWLPEVERRGAGEIIITSISKEGTFKGLDIELINLASSLTSLPITYSGGFGKLEDLDELINENINLSGLALGGVLHYEKLSVNQIRKHALSKGIKVRQL